METVLIHSENEYYAYCTAYEVGDIHRKYASQGCDIINGKKDDHWEVTSGKESLHITSKPLSYPCVLAIHTEEGDHDLQYGAFIYPGSFEE